MLASGLPRAIATDAASTSVRGRATDPETRLHHRRHGHPDSNAGDRGLVHRSSAGPVSRVDVAAACAGFVYGLGIADAMVRSGQYKRIVVVGVEILTRIIDWKDRNTCVLFGDGAGAVVVGPETASDRGVMSTHLYADGAGWEHLYLPAGGTRQPTTAQTVAENLHTVKMNGRPCFAGVPTYHGLRAALENNKMTRRRRLGGRAQRTSGARGVAQRSAAARKFANIQHTATRVASVPIALSRARADGRSSRDELIFCAPAPVLWASAMVKW